MNGRRRLAAACSLFACVFFAGRFCFAGLQCDEEVFDFGTAPTGEIITHTFRLKNTGSVPLRITDVDAPCDCLAVEWQKTELRPGEEWALPVQLNLSGLSGAQNRRIHVRADDSLSPTLTLRLQGFASPGLLVEPAVVVLHAKQDGSLPSAKVRVRAPDGAPFRILEILPRTESREFSFAAERTNSLEILISPCNPAPPGRQTVNFSIRTDHPEFRDAGFSIVTIARTDILASPEQIELDEHPGGSDTAEILFRSSAGEELQVLHLELPQDGMDWESEPLAGGLLRVRITGIHPVASLDGKQIRIHFSGSSERVMEVPIVVHKSR